MTTAAEQQPVGQEGPLECRVALVTGGTRGIGAAISTEFAADCRVVREVIWAVNGGLDM